MGNVMKIAFKAEYLSICAPCVSDEKTRYYLQGVSLSGWIAAATDGHVMILARLDSDPESVALEPEGCAPEPIILPLSKDLLRHCREARKDHGTRYVVVSRGEGLKTTIRIVVANCGQAAIDAAASGAAAYTWETQLIDGVFPDYRAVLPRSETIPPVAPAFNLSLLDKFSIAAGSGGARIVPTSADKPAAVTFSRPDVFGVIMPMRNDDHEAPASPPAWLA